ncbi:MAG: nucleoside triphosphate pyrophosphohydrolase [SAR324 cluster bacterium]|jgi:predicted house-cleaning noncanonical NTP pyrophosphatase (MazG superfamily)|nr:nucleoside triphosphate pyrophosphohydrolase [SAR324 cluster bacterium]
MKTVQTNKLVRDKICNNLVENGIADSVQCHPVFGREYQTYLFSKLMEECAEVIGANTAEQRAEEIADVREVLHAIAYLEGIEPHVIEMAQNEKFKDKGGFTKGIVMTEVTYK